MNADTYEFVTIGGATVTVAPEKDRFGRTVHPARCRGCGWNGPNFLDYARTAANKHAGQCRSKPRSS